MFRPVHLYWTSRDGKGCTDEDTRLLAATAINLLTDIIVVVLPAPLIRNLNIRTREKWTLGFLMSLGALCVYLISSFSDLTCSSATIASIVRTVAMAQSLDKMRYDTTWNAFYVWIWLLVECNLAIICISVPTLRPLFRKLFPAAFVSTNISKDATHTASSHVPRDAKHASFNSVELQSLKNDAGIEIMRPHTGYAHQRQFGGWQREGLGSNSTMNSRMGDEVGEHFSQHRYRPNLVEESERRIARAV